MSTWIYKVAEFVICQSNKRPSNNNQNLPWHCSLLNEHIVKNQQKGESMAIKFCANV